MLVRHVPLLAVLAGLTAQCDFSSMVVVTAPLMRPLPSACIKTTLDTITGRPQTRVEVDHAPPKGGHGTIFWLDALTPYRVVEQYEYRDSTATLETYVSRFPGRPFNKAEAESLGKQMGATLLRVRDACGGSAMHGAPPYNVKRKV